LHAGTARGNAGALAYGMRAGRLQL
jgi:hypothetical protein